MARDSTAVTEAQHCHDTASSLLDRVEAGLIAKMENGSAKKDRHQHGHGREKGNKARLLSRAEIYGEKKKHHLHSSQAMSSQGSSQDVSGISVDLDAPQRYFPTPEKKVELEKLNSQTPVGGQGVKPEQAIDDHDDENEKEEKLRPKEEKRRRKEERRAARHSLEGMKTQALEGVGEQVVNEEKIVPETPRKEKRKLDTQMYDPESHQGSTSKVSPHLQVGENCTENTPKHKKQRNHSQESPLHLHTVSAYKSPSIPGPTNFDEILNDTVGTPKRKKKKMGKEIKSKGLNSAKGALFKTVLKGCASSISNDDSTSGEVRKTPSIDEEYSSEDATEEASRLESPSPIKPPKSRVNVPNSISPIRPKKETGNEFRKETPILPPIKLVQSTKQSPVSIQNLARLKKEKEEPVTHNEDDNKDGRKTKKRKESASKIFKASKTSKEAVIEDEEDPFVQAMDSIRRSSSIMQNLFSPAPNTLSASIANKKKEQSDSSAKVEGAKIASTTTVLPLVLNEEGVNMAREDWEVTLGKLRSSAGGDDDSEAQESTLTKFP
ncbi:hypothetical protein NA56DRAFT_120405 [Hyaloscypha hepaticicola]|uniref:Uncharacterized protein n=1 Tax=Hyaloscypha hepaticicola TaxID=2082293 RepID=A0A2J6Q5V3_9HELO|nr:hypothetical protein NA56DRAFT_120405 [Hyaloscypha hepaticicola]